MKIWFIAELLPLLQLLFGFWLGFELLLIGLSDGKNLGCKEELTWFLGEHVCCFIILCRLGLSIFAWADP